MLVGGLTFNSYAHLMHLCEQHASHGGFLHVNCQYFFIS